LGKDGETKGGAWEVNRRRIIRKNEEMQEEEIRLGIISKGKTTRVVILKSAEMYCVAERKRSRDCEENWRVEGTGGSIVGLALSHGKGCKNYAGTELVLREKRLFR